MYLRRFLTIVMLFLTCGFGLLSPAHAADLPMNVLPSGALPMPELSLMDSDKNTFSLKDREGRLTIVHFWATWCAPCVTELPALNKFADAYRSSEVLFVVVSLDNILNAEKVQEFYKKHNINSFPIVFAKQADVMKKFEIVGLPTTIFINNGLQMSRADSDLEWNQDAMSQYVESLVVKAE